MNTGYKMTMAFIALLMIVGISASATRASRVWSIISTTAEHPASTSRAMRNIRITCARHVKF